MKRFELRELSQAYAWSMGGGQALHVHTLTMGHRFFSRYSVIAHLFDQDKDRLATTARSLGVRSVVIEHEGTRKQHVDLCGKPLERALDRCHDDE